MSEMSIEILKLMKQTRKIFEQVGALLSTADGLMGEAAWDTTTNTCLSGSSASINLPKQWMPYEVFRFYKKEDSPNLLLFVCVLLDERDDYESEFSQSLITAGSFNYGESEEGDKWEYWEYWWSRFHGYMPERTDDGVVHHVDPKIQWPNESYPFEGVSTFAWPLASITNTSDLKEKIIEPLLQLIQGKDADPI